MIEFNQRLQFSITPILEGEIGAIGIWESLVLMVPVMVLLSLPIFYYSRLSKKKIFENRTRHDLIELIGSNPGIYFNEIKRVLGNKPGSLLYHLNVLERNEIIRSRLIGNYRSFCLFDERNGPDLILTLFQRLLLFKVYSQPGLTQTEMSRQIGKSRTVIFYNASILRDFGLIFVDKNGRTTRYYVSCKGTEIVESGKDRYQFGSISCISDS